MAFTLLNLFVLLGYLVIRLISMLVIKVLQPNFYNKDIGIINFGKFFLLLNLSKAIGIGFQNRIPD